ncbi:OmpH family outer membrane protein [Geopsychrobacter electrodiphilus]|uniref:OmpH family outer membrane protein n=1 Tax=Geopsychrobacter electrodiphilus TaxID=225196 RepID=UPI0003617CD1|nr:OmpH family outer membrane protein [Geopsychrobacter electrodiphilus]
MKKIVLAAILLFVASTTFAAGGVGFIDLQKALNLSNAGVKAKADIGQQVKKYEAKVTAEQDALKEMKSELDKQSVLLSDEARSKKEREFQQRAKEFQRFTKDIQDELKQKDADFTKRIIDQILKVTRKLGKEKGYVIVLEKSESSLVYGDSSVDLTDDVIKAYNASN